MAAVAAVKALEAINEEDAMHEGRASAQPGLLIVIEGRPSPAVPTLATIDVMPARMVPEQAIDGVADADPIFQPPQRRW
jgi:hypothetical protein